MEVTRKTAGTAQFKVASHILEDLGLTLYTSLARVLVEFVANAYDADASEANIDYDPDTIQMHREKMRAEYKLELTQANGTTVEPLDTRTLPDNATITILDDGHGMDRAALTGKFLVAGRRRRIEDKEENGLSPAGRPLMGRKGLGKLAGFGVAKLITVTSRAKGEQHATQVVLDFDEIHNHKFADEILVPINTIQDGDGLPEGGGTRVVLQRLLHGPTKNQRDTIAGDLSEHFALIDPQDFAITLANSNVEPDLPEHAFAWPEPEKAIREYIEHEYETENGQIIKFNYRLRFTKDRKSLKASRRGIRVYSNKRLCAAPSLLEADTNMHGFRMVDYLDGIVHADFISEQDEDYIATDRQGLRWESPLLEPMYIFLSQQIKVACREYQNVRDKNAEVKVKEDDFTMQAIEEAGLSARDIKTAHRVASMLGGMCKEGIEGQEYKDKLPALIQGIGHGTILTEIAGLAEEPNPDLDRLAFETTRLTHDELGRFMSTVRGRLRAMEGLEKIVRDVNFANRQNESQIQELLEGAPWIINPTYTQFLSADVTKKTTFDRLAQELQIGKHAPAVANESDRPDLVFFIGSQSLSKLVIVELKSANLPLELQHLTQLERYMHSARDWLADRGQTMTVDGILIGTRAPDNVKRRGVIDLQNREKDRAIGAPWIVKDYIEVLEHTKLAHYELVEIHEALLKSEEEDV